jgi:hypothetical protein
MSDRRPFIPQQPTCGDCNDMSVLCPIGELKPRLTPGPVFISGAVLVATKGHRTKGRLRWLLSTLLCRSRRWVNDGSVGGRPKLASLDHLVCVGEQEMRHGDTKRLGSREVDGEPITVRTLDR